MGHTTGERKTYMKAIIIAAIFLMAVARVESDSDDHSF
jgi:hypothetical protein